jgi:hypothetical protein
VIRHLAGEPIDGVQRCEWCRVVLVEYWPEIESKHPRELFFRPGRELLDNGNGTIVTDTEGSIAPRCIPEVEGVDIR